MIIDKNGKVFGKINIIDLLVLIVLVAAIFVVGSRFLLPKQKSTQTIQMQFYLEERRRERMRRRMEQGYLEMGEINLELACACFHADTETTLRYEENLG